LIDSQPHSMNHECIKRFLEPEIFRSDRRETCCHFSER